jgi:very-short-patch-repair endonuclease
MIECQICKRQLGTLVGKHLKSHGLSSHEYQEKFPGHPVSAMKPWTEELRAKQKQVRTGRKHSAETKQKIGAGNKGKIMPREAVERQKESYQKFLESNGGSPQKGYKRSDEFKERMSHIAQTRDPALVQQKVEQMWAARRGQKMTDEQKARYSEARLDFIEKNPYKIIPKLFNTKPEQEFEQILVTKNIAYSKNKRVGNRLFDFVVEDCVIEIDGPYHWNPLMHGNKTMTLEERTLLLREMQTRDALKTQLAKENGYRVFRLDVTSYLPKDWYERLKAQGWDIF